MMRFIVERRWAEANPSELGWLSEQFATAAVPVAISDAVQESHAVLEVNGTVTMRGCPLTERGMDPERLKEWMGYCWGETGYFVMPGQHVEGE